MRKAGLYSLVLFALGGLALFFLVRPWILGAAAFLLTGMIGCVIASRVFNRLATPDEKRQDLEDRVRNSDL